MRRGEIFAGAKIAEDAVVFTPQAITRAVAHV